jgi:hypothetical protein
VALQVADEEVARRDAVAHKVDNTAMYAALEQKADLAHVTEALASKAERSQVEGLRQQQAMSSDVPVHVVALKDELQCKASSKVRCHGILCHLIGYDSAPHETAPVHSLSTMPSHALGDGAGVKTQRSCRTSAACSTQRPIRRTSIRCS